MLHILVHSDSLTWGIIPETRKRLPFDQRWPGMPGRNGKDGLAQRIEMHSPLALVILMLGTNDFQFSHPYNNAWSSAQGIGALVAEIRSAPIEPGMPVPPVLIVCPPRIQAPRGCIAPKFSGAELRCDGL